jgi:HK97 gp10 family phage protein
VAIDVEVKNLLEVQRELERKIAELHGEPILRAMREATLLVDRDAKKNAPVDVGRLRASITPSVKQEGTQVIGIVGSNVKYAAAVELGSKPHMPPVQAIAEWVRHKKLAGTYSIKTHKRMGSKSRQGGEDLSLAWAIALKIKKFGTKPHPFLVPAFKQNRDAIYQIFQRAVKGITSK